MGLIMLLALPSRYIPYNFKQVNLKTISPAAIPFFARAVETDDLAPVLEAMQTCIDVDVNELTEGDFYYILTIMRVVIFKRNALVARWRCQSDMFQRPDTKERWTRQNLLDYVEAWNSGVREGMVDPATLPLDSVVCDFNNEEKVEPDDLILHYLPEQTEDSVPLQLHPSLDFPRARHLAECYQLSDDVDHGPLVRVAKWVRDGRTIMEKIDLIMADMDLYELALDAEANYRHGVTRYVKKKCRCCDEYNTLHMEVTPQSFL